MKREPGIPLWYCAHGLPRGFEASVFRAQGLAPLQPTKTYTRMVEVAGYKPETGHAEDGALWLWVPEPLAHLIPCGVELPHRVWLCITLNKLDATARVNLLIELDAAVRLAGAAAGFIAVLGPWQTNEEMHEAWRKIYPVAEREKSVHGRSIYQ
jgi:hypothetical protein